MSGDIYWERQSFTLLCGVHALNSLLQGPYFTKKKLDKISQELDNEEKALYESLDPSENFDETGFYSIQVISKALLSKKFDCCHYTVKLFENWDSQNQSAFLLHYGLHWIPIRKIGAYWYLLDSLRPTGPQALLEKELRENIRETLSNQRYCWFTVNGEFKKYKFSKHQLKAGQFLIPVKEILQQRNGHAWGSTNTKIVIIDSLADELACRRMAHELNFSQEELMMMAIEKSQSVCSSNIKQKKNYAFKREYYNSTNYEKQEDKENDENLDDEEVNIRLCLPSLEFISRRFKARDTLDNILKWAKKESSFKNLKLFLDFPKRVFYDKSLKIKDSGISAKCNVIYSES